MALWPSASLSHSFKDGTLRRKSWSAVWAFCLTFQGWDIAQDVFVCSGVTVGQLSHPSRMGHCAGCLRLQWRCLRVQWSHCGPAVSPFSDGTLRRMCWSTVDSLWASCLTLQAWDIAQDVMVYRGVTVGQLSHPLRMGHCAGCLGLQRSHCGPAVSLIQ